jgi:uncharacterized protein
MSMRKDRSWPILDLHCHIGPPLLAEELIHLMDRAGVDQAVVFPTPFVWSLPSKENYYNTNDYIADAQARYPQRLIGFACINPAHNGSPELGMPSLAALELERCVKELGLHGCKIHPENHCFAVDSLVGSAFMGTVVRLQDELGMRLPILSHGMTTIGAQPDQFVRLAAAYPGVSLVIAHGGGFQNLYFPSIQPVTQCPNLYVDTSMTTVDDSHLLNVTAALGVGKVVFGSDHFARNQGHLYENFFYVLERAFPRPEDQERVFSSTLRAILGRS